MFIGYSAATELSGYTFTDRSETRQCLCDRYRPPASRRSGAAVRKVSLKEREEESGQRSVSGCLSAPRTSAGTCDAETGFHQGALHTTRAELNATTSLKSAIE
ncbi:hypothetical protein VZT92_019602 [Zoarces viviparus]|uniref:Uncharacterized protein n=1 Tax=Zoarces viviparus TaxID=48416 RepID=A0AAW1EPI4_ZOAVI